MKQKTTRTSLRKPVAMAFRIVAAVAVVAAASYWIGFWALALVLSAFWFWTLISASAHQRSVSFQNPEDAIPHPSSSQQELNDWLSNPAYSHLPSNAYHRDT